jgi:hypothetical protein
MSAGLAVAVLLAGGSVAAGLYYVWRARNGRERLAAAAGVLYTVLLWGGLATLWQCGEDDCGALVPIYWISLALSAMALALLLRRTGPR